MPSRLMTNEVAPLDVLQLTWTTGALLSHDAVAAALKAPGGLGRHGRWATVACTGAEVALPEAFEAVTV